MLRILHFLYTGDQRQKGRARLFTFGENTRPLHETHDDGYSICFLHDTLIEVMY